MLSCKCLTQVSPACEIQVQNRMVTTTHRNMSSEIRQGDGLLLEISITHVYFAQNHGLAALPGRLGCAYPI